MRRPSPLPAPAAPPQAEKPARSRRAARAAVSPETREPSEETSSEDPQSADAAIAEARSDPASLASMRQAAALQTALIDRSSEGSPPAPAPDEPIRVRDVWQAARARRRALRAEVRRFTGRQRHRRAIWIGAAASVVLLVLVTLGAAYSPLFAVEKITVAGASQLDASAVVSALDSQLGVPLPLVSESDVKAALVTFPLVESYSLEARPPHELVVRIVERTPVGVIQTRAGYTLVDAAGVALSTTATAPSDQPVLDITGGVTSTAFTAAGTVMRSLPDDIRAQVTAVSASTPDDVTLTLGGTNTQVMWGGADQSALKAVVLAKTMVARPPATVSLYDVSSPQAVVVG